VTNATLAVAVVRNLSVLRPELGAPGLGASVAIGVIWLFTIVNCLGVRTAGGVQVVTTFLKLIPLGGAIVALFTFIGHGQPVASRCAVWCAFVAFAIGLSTTIAAMVCGYVSHAYSWQERPAPANRWENVGLAMTALALLAFIVGSGATLSGLLANLPR
jgi:amino acid transporter